MAYTNRIGIWLAATTAMLTLLGCGNTSGTPVSNSSAAQSMAA
ncbi:hypothetical protein [Antrihabitans stalagmiti]|nr:hypothetical protein [Antrihabitans stalagmiti]